MKLKRILSAMLCAACLLCWLPAMGEGAAQEQFAPTETLQYGYSVDKWFYSDENSALLCYSLLKDGGFADEFLANGDVANTYIFRLNEKQLTLLVGMGEGLLLINYVDQGLLAYYQRADIPVTPEYATEFGDAITAQYAGAEYKAIPAESWEAILSTQDSGGEPAQGEISMPSIAVPEAAADAVEDSELIAIKGVFIGELAQALDETYVLDDAQFQGMSDCIVVFDYANDDINRRLPDRSGGTTSDGGTLTINGQNSYRIFDPRSNACSYIKSIVRYAGYAYPIDYGNLLGGAEPVRMCALFYVNPNDLNGAEEIELTIGDQRARFPAADVQRIANPDEILAVEDDYEQAHQVGAFKWHMDKALLDTAFVAGAQASFGKDFKSMGETMNNTFNASVDWGTPLYGAPSGGFSDVNGVKFEKSGVSWEVAPIDLEKVKAAYPESAGLIGYMARATHALGDAIVNSKTTAGKFSELAANVTNAYLDLCEAFGMQDIASYYESQGISLNSLNKFMKSWNSSNLRAHVVVTYDDKATVQKVQQALNDAGYDCGTPDGVAGKNTVNAIQAYQQANGLQATGTITDELLNHMNITAEE